MVKKLLLSLGIISLGFSLVGCSKIKSYENKVEKKDFVAALEEKISVYNNKSYSYEYTSNQELDTEELVNDKVTSLTEEVINETKKVSVDLTNKIMNEEIKSSHKTKVKSDSGSEKSEESEDLNYSYQKNDNIFFMLDNHEMKKYPSSESLLYTKYALTDYYSHLALATNFYVDDNTLTIVYKTDDDPDNKLETVTQYIFSEDKVEISTESITEITAPAVDKKMRGKVQISTREVYKFGSIELKPKNIEDYK